ncbi:hypothetical protein SAMN05216167_15215 [Spirosoma endophyticum]|uniref:Uncharacterized protein n=1 Tax=Spirosoma endophyticum TaxID=662367 RepID=A0A1I2I0Y3_9BACT|nr:hypothetical protein SAMN05216167_15215 [Spirosoma endophyticum]
MNQQQYTAIPDTSDNQYWIRTLNSQDRSTTFVPRDKELHRLLKQNAKKLSQPASSYKKRAKKD